MKLAIRTDASLLIGSGHVMRCKTLADAWCEYGAQVRFVCREHPGNLIQLLVDASYSTVVLPAPTARGNEPDTSRADYSSWLGVGQSEDAQQTLEALADFNPDWLVVDHYGLDATWEGLVRSKVRRILSIDDLANRFHDCDLLLNQNLHKNFLGIYTGLVPSHARRLLGPRFALLRPEFHKARETLSDRGGVVRRILVFFGGVDPTRETDKALAAIAQMERSDITTDVVVGSSNPCAEMIAMTCREMRNVNFHKQVSNMAELMAQADLGLGAGGSASWERCCVGLPTLVTVIADNQADATQELVQAGAAISLGLAKDVGVADYLEGIRGVTAAQLNAVRTAGLALVDGRGTKRIFLAMCGEAVRLRRANVGDADKTWPWRNHEDTRRFFIDPAPVPMEQHREWWNKSLADSTRILLLASVCGKEFGVLRFDLASEKAMVSIYLDPGLHGLGLGSMLIKAGGLWMKENCPSVRVCEAIVLGENSGSQRAFAAAGYTKVNRGLKWIQVLRND